MSQMLSDVKWSIMDPNLTGNALDVVYNAFGKAQRYDLCPTCDGTGSFTLEDMRRDEKIEETCGRCGGDGVVPKQTKG